MKNILLTILTISSLTVFAQTFSGGSGSPTDPFIIETYDDLVELSTTWVVWQHNFVQTNDINASDSKFLNIGDHDGDPNTPDEPMGLNTIGDFDTKFTGSYQGKGHTISGLKINRPTEEYIGLFGYVETAEINNIVLEYCDVTGANYVGGMIGMNLWSDVSNLSVETGKIRATGRKAGGLIGLNYQSDIDNCSATGVVYGYRECGGLIGMSLYASSITNSHSLANILAFSECGGLIGTTSSATIYNCYSKGRVDCDASDIGGLVGEMNTTTINKCYATGDVFGSARIGGFVGSASGNSQVQNCYSSGIVIGDQGYAGGFMGRNLNSSVKNCYSTGLVYSGIPAAFCAGNDDGSTIENCYATGHVEGRGNSNTGFCYTNAATAIITNCYFDMETTFIGTGDGIDTDENHQTVSRLTTDEFKNRFNFHANWNINGAEIDVQPWVSNPEGRPFLYWQDITVSNELAEKVNTDKYTIDGDYLNRAGLIISSRGYRYKRITSTYWSYLTVNTKADGIGMFRIISEFDIDKEYIVQAYVTDDAGNRYYGDAVYVDTRESTLPVSLLEFTAECNGNYIGLNWSTASELNNDYFTIEVSHDATNWEVLEYVAGSGTISVQSDYFLSADATNGTQYFRLSQTDFDGTYEILQVASVSCMNAVEVEISIYPNPATDFVKISNAFESEISIYNSIGCLVKPSVNTESEIDTYTIDTSDLPAGVYYVAISKNGNVETKSLVISR